jgi:hypothetical protein
MTMQIREIEKLAYTVRDVARIFGVPPFLLADETRTTFASASAALSYFAANTLRPWIVRLERAFQMSVLTSRYHLQLDLNALLKADPDAFAASLLKLRQGGMITANEARAMLGLPTHGPTPTAKVSFRRASCRVRSRSTTMPIRCRPRPSATATAATPEIAEHQHGVYVGPWLISVPNRRCGRSTAAW